MLIGVARGNDGLQPGAEPGATASPSSVTPGSHRYIDQKVRLSRHRRVRRRQHFESRSFRRSTSVAVTARAFRL